LLKSLHVDGVFKNSEFFGPQCSVMRAILTDVRRIRCQRTYENGSFPFSDIFANEQLAKHAEERKFCFVVEDSKAEKLSASGAPGALPPNHS